jgi:beta-glucosidase
MHNDSVVDERALREIYLTGFEIAVHEGNPLALMTSYNRVNGSYANENGHLLREILAEEWGFKGIVISDWGGSNDRVKGLETGNHLEMPATNGDSDREIVRAVEEGRISESLLDQRVGEYLRVLDAVAPGAGSGEGTGHFDVDAHHAFARKAAASSIVLLKNDDNILPLKAGVKTAVLGCFAEAPRYQGAGSSVVNPTRLDIPLDHLKAGGLDIIGYAGAFKRNGGDDDALLAAAVALAKQAEVVLMYMGLDELLESEGMDRDHLRIRENQMAALKAVSEVNPRVVVVLSGGAVVETPWLDDGHCKALIHGYLGGQAGAGAMVDALTGVINPSGKLTETWPLVYEDTPSYNYYPGMEKTAEYRESVFVGYRYYETANIPVRFPFGYGLSYTTFAYSDLRATEKSVTFTLTNTGSRAGAEVAQVYISARDSGLFRPLRELKAFEKVYLEAGESKTLTLPLDEKAFRYFNAASGRFEIEDGVYHIEAGASARDIKLETDVRVSGSAAAPPYSPETLPSYYAARINKVGDKEFETLLGRPIPQARWDRSRPLERNDTFSQLFYARGWIGRLVYKVIASGKDRIGKDGKPDLNMLFIFNMPFRGIAKMMGGAVDIAMVDAMLEIFNGSFFKGIGHLAAAWVRKGRAVRKTARKLALAAAKGTKPR